MSQLARQIADNLARVRERIATAASRSGRTGDAITLVAATKYVSTEATRAVLEAGCHDLGESRPQQLWSKSAEIDPTAEIFHESPRWHLIGHLQRNKIRRTLPLVHLIHSIDSSRLLAAVNDEAELANRIVPVLLEVNISGDDSKTGMEPGQIAPLLAEAAQLGHVQIRGLMGMASLEGDQQAARDDFIRLRQLRDHLASQAPALITLDELSMGMSGDFEIAIEEGATIVRVGSLLFEGLES